MATVVNAFLARNRRFDAGDEVADDDPLVAEFPALFGLDVADEDEPEGDD